MDDFKSMGGLVTISLFGIYIHVGEEGNFCSFAFRFQSGRIWVFHFGYCLFVFLASAC
jgi:hypothetical protein